MLPKLLFETTVNFKHNLKSLIRKKLVQLIVAMIAKST